MPSNGLDVPYILSVLCVLKVISPDLYEAARAGSLSVADLDGHFHFSRWRDQQHPEKLDKVAEDIEGWWRYVVGELSNEELASRYERGISVHGFSHPSQIVLFYCDLVDGLSFPDAIVP
jgi:hypothetical protein